MRRPLFAIAGFCLLIPCNGLTQAQSGPAVKATEPKNIVPAKSAAAKTAAKEDAEAARMVRERRANAQSLLISLASDAVSFKDQKLRARTLARIADVLWDSDAERGRTLFRKAWDAAESADQESRRTSQEEVGRQAGRTGGSAAIMAPPNLRGEVLRLSARRDRALGEEFLAKLKTENQQEATEASDRARPGMFEAPEAISQRLNLAHQLLDTDVERALQFADIALATFSMYGLDFLSYLREKDPAAADRRYAMLLANAAGNPQSDANTVSLLSSYLFTPHTYVTFSGNGSSTSQTSRTSTAPQVAPELRAAFFQAAGDILLRPLPQDQNSRDIQSKYLVMKRLMPLFDEFAPKELADLLHAQMDALTTNVPEDARSRDDDTLRQGIRPPEKSEDREKTLLDRLDRAKTSEERDQLYMQLARLMAENDDPRAHDYVNKIDDTDMRNQVRAYIDGSLLMRAVDAKSSDRVLELVRTGELTHLQKAWALSQVAKLLNKTDHDKALALVDEATTEARRIDASDADRPRTLIAVATVYLVIDRTKAWDALYDAAKGANAVDTFSGEDGVMKVSLITKGTSSIRSSSTRDFDIAPIFNELAHDDYNRAVELARLLEREAPRANATIAIARAVLEEKKK